jgi:rubrerythrin
MIEDMTIKGCMEFAVATEELGAKMYTRLAETFGDTKDMAELFTRLAEDEKIHKQLFSALLQKISTEKGDTPENLDYLKAMSISEFFSRHRGPFHKIDTIRDRNDALETALNFEKATLGFYKAMEDVLGKQEPLTQVMETEKKHIVILMKALLVEGSAFRGLQDIWP